MVLWPKAVAKIIDDVEALLSFYDFPAEHWIHLKTTDESVNTWRRLGAAVGGASRRPGVCRRSLPARGQDVLAGGRPSVSKRLQCRAGRVAGAGRPSAPERAASLR